MIESSGKDAKIFEIFKSAMECSFLVNKLRYAFILTFQLEKYHLGKLDKDFSIVEERKFIQGRLLDLKLLRSLNLQFRVTEGVEGYKYFDNIIEGDNPNNVYNFDEELEGEIASINLRLLTFFAQVVKTLDIEQDLSSLLSS